LQRLSPHGLCWATVDEGLPMNTKKKKDQFGTQMFIGSSTMNVSIFSHFITYMLNTSNAKKYLFTSVAYTNTTWNLSSLSRTMDKHCKAAHG
jgi:hypothetical protein